MIEPVARSFALLEALSRRPSGTISTLADETGLPPPTVVRLLKNLAELGYATRVSRDAGYRLTDKVLGLAQGIRFVDRLVDGHEREAHERDGLIVFAVVRDRERAVLGEPGLHLLGDVDLAFAFLSPVYGSQLGLPAVTIGLIAGSMSASTIAMRVVLPMLVRRIPMWRLLIGSLVILALGYLAGRLGEVAHVTERHEVHAPTRHCGCARSGLLHHTTLEQVVPDAEQRSAHGQHHGQHLH